VRDWIGGGDNQSAKQGINQFCSADDLVSESEVNSLQVRWCDLQRQTIKVCNKLKSGGAVEFCNGIGNT